MLRKRGCRGNRTAVGSQPPDSERNRPKSSGGTRWSGPLGQWVNDLAKQVNESQKEYRVVPTYKGTLRRVV